jgi:hypothetical protein
MEENTPLEQYLELDEEQLHAITGGTSPEEYIAAITAHKKQARKLEEMHNQNVREGYPEPPIALVKAQEHYQKAEALQKAFDKYKDDHALLAKPGNKWSSCFGCSSVNTVLE